MLGAPRDPAGRLLPALTLVLVSAAIFAIAYDNGSYGIEARNGLAIAVWWAAIVCAALRATPLDRLRGPVLVVAGLIAALTLLTLASMLWAPSAEAAFDETNRVALYLGVLVLVALLVPRGGAGLWADALAVALVGVAAVALASRFFPDLFGDRGLAAFLPSATSRLSFPLGYWNGVGILLALGVPLLLRLAVVSRSAFRRGLSLVPFPVIGAAVYLTSSRGAVATALVGALVFLVLTERRWEAGCALGVSAMGVAATIAILLDRHELVNGPIGPAATDQGRSAAWLVLAIGLGTGLAYALVSPLLRSAHPPRTLGRIVMTVVVLALAAGVVAADPLERVREFRAPPGQQTAFDRDDFISAHLLSGSGSGRWQFWSSAVDQWQSAPLLGGGAGSYEAWWAQHGSFSYFLRDAHSLYLEALGELGPLGLLLTAGLVSFGAFAGARRARALEGPARASAAALTAVVAGFAVAAAIDWMWELTAVTVVAVVALALVTGPATEPLAAVRLARPDEHPPRRVRFGVAVAALVVAWSAIVCSAVPLLAQYELARSREAVTGGEGTAARDAALSARDIQPWAASPYLQLALVEERLGRLDRARERIADAIERSPEDWRLWLVAARLDTKLGQVRKAERTLARAVELNPRSPLFSSLRMSER